MDPLMMSMMNSPFGAGMSGSTDVGGMRGMTNPNMQGVRSVGPNAYGYMGSMNQYGTPATGPVMDPNFWGPMGDQQLQRQSQNFMQGIPGISQGYMGQQLGLQQQQLALERYKADLASKTALAPLDFAKQKFGQVFPFLAGQMGSINSLFGLPGQTFAPTPIPTEGGRMGPSSWQSTPPGAVGGSGFGSGMAGSPLGPPAPSPINTGPIYNPQQINEALNSARAYNDQSGRTQQNEYMQGMAGRGFGSFSPSVAQGLQNIGNQTRESNVNMGFQIPFQLASANRNMQLQSQTAAGNQRLGEYNAFAQPAWQYVTSGRNALVNALGSMA